MLLLADRLFAGHEFLRPRSARAARSFWCASATT
jgi:hypothetical protein